MNIVHLIKLMGPVLSLEWVLDVVSMCCILKRRQSVLVF